MTTLVAMMAIGKVDNNENGIEDNVADNRGGDGEAADKEWQQWWMGNGNPTFKPEPTFLRGSMSPILLSIINTCQELYICQK